MQDLVLADHAVVIADDPELDLDTHARPKGCHCQSAKLSADTIADHPHLPHFALLPKASMTLLKPSRAVVATSRSSAKSPRLKARQASGKRLEREMVCRSTRARCSHRCRAKGAA